MKDNIFKSDPTGRAYDSAFEFMDTMPGSRKSTGNGTLKGGVKSATKSTATAKKSMKSAGDCSTVGHKTASKKTTTSARTTTANHKKSSTKKTSTAPKQGEDYIVVEEVIVLME